jgi:nitroreductase
MSGSSIFQHLFDGDIMEFFDVIRSRQSVRVFTKREIDKEVVTPLLKAIQTSPTAGNLQAYQIYLVKSPEKIKELGIAAYNQECISGAPAVLVFCTDPPRSEVTYGERGRDLYCLQDATIAGTIAHLASVALGLGSVMVGAFREIDVARIVGAPKNQLPILMLPIGYPNEEPVPTSRRSLDDLVVRL